MKNKKLKMVAGVMVLSMVATCMMSGTLAKYTTGGNASDRARVAKWGVQVEAAGVLFGNSYGSDNQLTTTRTLNTMSVEGRSTSTDNWVAPGTKNDQGFRFSITGEPEVSGEIKSVIQTQNIFLNKGRYGIMVPLGAGEVTSENFDEYLAGGKLYFLRPSGFNAANSTFDENAGYYMLQNEFDLNTDYYPVIYSLNGAASENGIKKDSLLNVAKLISDKLGNAQYTSKVNGVSTYEGTGAFTPSDPAEGIILEDQVLTWEWSYENGSSEEEKAMYNAADTYLEMLQNLTVGNAVKFDDSSDEYKILIEHQDYNLQTQFDINLTVTQTD